MSKLKEQKAKHNFQKHSLGRLNIKLVENQIGQGMSDMICINRRGTVAWLEAKAIDNWPVRPSTLPLKNAFEPGQIPFMKEWCSWKGNAYVLLKAEDEFYLIHPKGQFDVVDMTQAEIRALSVRSGIEEIITYLEAL